MTNITIDRKFLEEVVELFDGAITVATRHPHEILRDIRAALAAPATAPEQMPLERDCICHQDLHLDAYSGGAAPEGLHGALWVVVEGVRKKYVLADQSSEPKDMPALATTPKQPRPFVPWSKEAEMLESWAAQSATAPAQPEIVDLLAEMYELILANKVVLAEKSGGVWTWPDRAIEAVRKHRSGPAQPERRGCDG